MVGLCISKLGNSIICIGDRVIQLKGVVVVRFKASIDLVNCNYFFLPQRFIYLLIITSPCLFVYFKGFMSSANEVLKFADSAPISVCSYILFAAFNNNRWFSSVGQFFFIKIT